MAALVAAILSDATNTGTAAPPVATVAITPTAIAAAPIAIFAQFGRDQFPSTSKRLTGSFMQYANRL